MIDIKDIEIYKNRVRNYDSSVTEKEIETEFYNFFKKYYENKYTIISEGKINYTAPYNIDGLLEIRTLDTDYRVLVEAKANRNFKDKKVCNEVLAQAIYYCQKLNHYGELIPAIILLIEKSSLILIKTVKLKELIELDYNGLSACSAYKTDERLINELNNMNYEYEYYEFNHDTDYNEIFNLIDTYGHNNEYKITKSRTFTGDNHMIIFNDFTNQYNNIRYYTGGDYKYVDGKWFIYDDKTLEWRDSNIAEVRRLLLDFIKINNYRTGKLDINYLIQLLKDYYTVNTVDYIKFNNCLLNINNGEVVNFDNEYFYLYEIDQDFIKKDVKSFKNLSFNELLNGDKKIFIETNHENYNVIKKFSYLFNININQFNFYSDKKITVFNNLEKININNIYDNLTINNIIIENIDKNINLNDLYNMLVSSISGSFDSFNENELFIEKWNENNDLI